MIGKSRSHLANTLRLLKLPAAVQALVQDGQLTAGHARALVGRDDAETLARRIVEEDLNVREVEALVQDEIAQAAAAPKPARPRRRGQGRRHPRLREGPVGLRSASRSRSSPAPARAACSTIKYGNFDQLDYIRARLHRPAER